MSENIVADFQWRYACKKFDPQKKLSESDLGDIVQALRLGASSYGLQPWKFIVVRNPEVREKLVPAAFGQRQVADASHLIVLCALKDVNEAHVDSYIADTARTRNLELSELDGFKSMLMKMIVNGSDEKKAAWAKNQVYIALGSLLSICASMRVDSCPMEGFRPKEVDTILDLEAKGLRSILMCPIGYRSVDDDYARRAKVRFAEDKVIEYID